MAFDSWTVPTTYKLTGTSSPRDDSPSTLQEGGRPIAPDYALEAARKSLSQAIPLWIVLPQERETSYLVKMRSPEDHSSKGSSSVWVDPYSGSVLMTWSARSAPLARKIEILNRLFHTGEILGYPGKTLACAISLALAMQTLTGFFLWRRDRGQPIDQEITGKR